MANINWVKQKSPLDGWTGYVGDFPAFRIQNWDEGKGTYKALMSYPFVFCLSYSRCSSEKEARMLAEHFLETKADLIEKMVKIHKKVVELTSGLNKIEMAYVTKLFEQKMEKKLKAKEK